MLLNKKGIAEVLGVSVSTIENLMRQGMPRIKIGKSVRFEPDVVIEWIKNRQ